MGFIILRLENSLTSFNKDNSANLVVKYLRIREKRSVKSRNRNLSRPRI